MYSYSRIGKVKTLHAPSSDWEEGTVGWEILSFSSKVNAKYRRNAQDLYTYGVNPGYVAPQVCGIYRITWRCPHTNQWMYEDIRITCDHKPKRGKKAVRPPTQPKVKRANRKVKKNQLEATAVSPAEQAPMPPPDVPFAYVQDLHRQTVAPQAFPSGAHVRGYTAEEVDSSSVDSSDYQHSAEPLSEECYSCDTGSSVDDETSPWGNAQDGADTSGFEVPWLPSEHAVDELTLWSYDEVRGDHVL